MDGYIIIIILIINWLISCSLSLFGLAIARVDYFAVNNFEENEVEEDEEGKYKTTPPNYLPSYFPTLFLLSSYSLDTDPMKALTIDDSLPILQKIHKYIHSDIMLHR